MSSLPVQDCKKDKLVSHQRVHTSDQALNRKRKNEAKTQLSPKKINLLKETQQPTNLRRKITDQDPVTPSKYP